MAFKMRGYSAFTKTDDKEKIKEKKFLLQNEIEAIEQNELYETRKFNPTNFGKIKKIKEKIRKLQVQKSKL